MDKNLHSPDKTKGRILRSTQETTGRKSPLPIIGKLKVGETVKDEKTGAVKYPRSVDYFIAQGQYEARFKEAFGETPSTIQILFVSNELEQSCNEYYELRDKEGNKAGYGDGETFMIWNPAKKEYEQRLLSNDPEFLDKAVKHFGSKKGWEINLSITFIIPKIKGIFGAWTFTTKGKNSSIPAIRDTFDMIKARAGGNIIGIPFDLNVQKVKSQTPGDKKNYPVVQLIPNVSQEVLEQVRNLIEGSNLDVNRIAVLDEQTVKQLSERNTTLQIGSGEEESDKEKVNEGKINSGLNTEGQGENKGELFPK